MTYAIEVNNLTKIYTTTSKQKFTALNNISLKIPKGKIFGLLGPNGAGKSTLINILGTVVINYTGNVKIMNYDLKVDPFLAKKSIGIVPQEINVDPFFSPLEILMFQQGLFGITPNKKHCLEVLEFMGLKEKANSRMRMLSGGMKRRVLIAKAIVNKSKVIILDEPTAGVDVDLRKKIWDGMIELNKQGTTIVLTTHYLEEAESLCEEIAIMNKGEVVAYDKTANLLTRLGSKSMVITVNNANPTLPPSLQKFLTKQENNLLFFNYHQNEESGLILQELFKHNIIITDIKTEETKLEEIFLKLTN